jgi:hypothetical protein
VTGSESAASSLRIRILSVPESGEFDEYDLSRFRVGDVYSVPARLASLLMIAGHAELASAERDRAADARRRGR